MAFDELLGRDGTDSRPGLSYSLKQFEGPLDLLLYLIQKAQVNIYDIPIAEITDQFIGYLDMSAQVDLDDLTDFYLMAAQLLLIKSRMLLPREKVLEDDEELDDPREQLVERLLEYQKYKRYMTLLAGSEQTEELYIPRRKTQFLLPFDDSGLWSEVSVWDLLKTFSSLLRSISSEQVFNVYEAVTTRMKITLMGELFADRSEISFLDLIIHPDSPMDVICAFLAVLEAVKFHMVTIVQHQLFGDILIKKRGEFDQDNMEELFEEDLLREEFPLPDEGVPRRPDRIQSRYTDHADDDDDDEVIEFDDEDDHADDE
jgi:segregation and condensation protein A